MLFIHMSVRFCQMLHVQRRGAVRPLSPQCDAFGIRRFPTFGTSPTLQSYLRFADGKHLEVVPERTL
jgi:hypothetical protein